MLQNLGGTESLLRISNQKLGDEVFGLVGDVSPVLVRKLIFAFLDALKQLVLGKKDPPEATGPGLGRMGLSQSQSSWL